MELFKKKVVKGNPTQKTQEAILKTLKDCNQAISLTSLAEKSNHSIYQVKQSVRFFEELGLIKIITSDKGTTLIIYENAKS